MRRLSPEEYQAAIEELARRYPLPDELRQQAKARYETVRKEYFEARKTHSPFTAEGASAIARLDEAQRRLEDTDLLYKVGKLTDSIEFTARTGSASGTAAALESLEAMYRERQTAVRQCRPVENSAK